MGNSVVPAVDKISAREFADCLSRYPACIEAISVSKGAKDGQKTLAELDEYRYGEVIDVFGSTTAKETMGIDDVKTLVEWKLRHGKFRPTLMKLVSSNDPDFVQETVQKAVKIYREKTDISAALKILTELKGIGPATASLLLSIHDAENVIFFADEAFYWLCCGGSKGPIKYNLKEYLALSEQAQALGKRLGVKAVEVERVAFALLRGESDNHAASKPPETKPADEEKKKKGPAPAKRKALGDNSDAKQPLRRRPAGPDPMITMGQPRRSRQSATLSSEPIQLSPRFAALKQDLIAGREDALTSSWNRLLDALQEEIRLVSALNSDIIPTIDYSDISNPSRADAFRCDLRIRGVAVIRGVIPRATALAWQDETTAYLHSNAHTSPSPLDAIFWSPAQIKARAHPNILSAQRFAMTTWAPSSGFSTCSPLSYADKLRLPTSSPKPRQPPSNTAHIDNGSVERWEPEGYGHAGTYHHILTGVFEQHDPWSSSARTRAAPDLYRGAGSCSIFRAFNGLLALGGTPASALRVCPLDLRLATAYVLLRPFFGDGDGSLVRPPTALLHGALPSYAQAVAPAWHPHLELARTLVGVPRLEPGDYVVWHPDAIHCFDDSVLPGAGPGAGVGMYLPAVPVTQTNALYLCRQRKAFLMGQMGPDFFGGGRGETCHAGRPGVGDVSEAGGEDGLRAMGLLPFDEEEAGDDDERAVLAMANEILFPGLYDDW
ncbi:hypothetical protein B0T18DRAFT_320167 [Schizothecium vesticola]|uniref:DUF1479-domain-containing protein n=1 Tax=Schizothecium vesticola TaxID=314040 RepID=A0AA40KAI0_9PEZI|nr:hypothetical protein B0T18DRAFT_320167 [Schizothecium vesticola]